MKHKGQDYTQIIIFAAALVTVVRYAAAFMASDMGVISGRVSDVVTFLMGITGLGMGLLDTFGSAYLFDGWRRVMPKVGQTWPTRFKVLSAFVIAIFATGLFILVPFTVSRVTHSDMEKVLNGGVWWWSIAVNIAPYLLIGGIIVGNSGIVTVNAEDLPEIKTENSGNFPVAKPRWNKVNPSDYAWISTARTGEIQGRYGIDERTARNWRTKAKVESTR